MIDPDANIVRGFRGSYSKLFPRYSNALPLSLDLQMMVIRGRVRRFKLHHHLGSVLRCHGNIDMISKRTALGAQELTRSHLRKRSPSVVRTSVFSGLCCNASMYVLIAAE